MAKAVKNTEMKDPISRPFSSRGGRAMCHKVSVLFTIYDVLNKITQTYINTHDTIGAIQQYTFPIKPRFIYIIYMMPMSTFNILKLVRVLYIFVLNIFFIDYNL